MTTIAIHQPNYLPYLGFFNKVKNCDIFVILDDVDFTKSGFFQRNKIRTSLNTPQSKGWMWLSVPVEEKHIPCNQIKIKNNIEWASYHWLQIQTNYSKSPFFSKYSLELKEIYNRTYDRAIDLNVDIINLLIKYFGLTSKIVFGSTLNCDSKGPKHLMEIVKGLGGDTYLSGASGQNYLDLSLFENVGIKVIFQDFEHPVYKQRYSGFVPNMSAIDYLFNVGAKL